MELMLTAAGLLVIAEDRFSHAPLGEEVRGQSQQQSNIASQKAEQHRL